MFYNLYQFTHGSLGLHFWDLPTLVLAVVLIVVLVVHSRNQKKREEKFEEARTEQLELLEKEVTGGTTQG